MIREVSAKWIGGDTIGWPCGRIGRNLPVWLFPCADAGYACRGLMMCTAGWRRANFPELVGKNTKVN